MLEHARGVARQNYEMMDKKRQIYASQMQSYVGELVQTLHGEKEELLEGFRQYRVWVGGQFKEMTSFYTDKYEYLLEERDLQRQREKETLLADAEDAATRRIRQLQSQYEAR